MYLGIDCGTQGTKAVLFDPKSGQVIGRGHSPHELIVNTNGRREQNAAWWIDALKVAVAGAIKSSGRSACDVAAIAATKNPPASLLA